MKRNMTAICSKSDLACVVPVLLNHPPCTACVLLGGKELDEDQTALAPVECSSVSYC